MAVVTPRTIVVQAPPLTPGQQVVADHPARFKVVVKGRRWGGSWFATYYALGRAMAGRRAWIVAPIYRQSEENFNLMRSVANQLPKGLVTVKLSDLLLEFPGGGSVQCKSGDYPDHLRGAGLDLLVLDEAAFLSPAVWNAAAPALMDRRGAALFSSSPNGRNWFWELYMRGQDPLLPDWQSWRFPTWTNPAIPPDEVESLRRTMPERMFREEIAAEFLDAAGLVFRNLDAVCTAAPEPGRTADAGPIVFGVDWGRESDYTAISVFDVARQRQLYLDRFTQIGWALQRGRLRALYDRFRPRVILAEANSIGGPNIEALQAEGLPVRGFDTTAKSKGPLIDGLALALEQGAVTLLADPVLRAELAAYELERLPSGTYRYSAPAGQHDDTVIATALSVQAGQSNHVARHFRYNPIYGPGFNVRRDI